MVKIDDLDVVVFDFDDTLCIHEKRDTDNEREYNRDIFAGKDIWKSASISTHIKEFMQECDSKGIKMGLISATISFQHMVRKNDWVSRSYEYDLENYCVGNADDKVNILIAISDSMGIDRSRIMIVDDRYTTLHQCDMAGFIAASPMEIVNYIENKRRN